MIKMSKKAEENSLKTNQSSLRKRYKIRYVFRLSILVYAFIMMYFVNPESLSVLNGSNFFHDFTWGHVLWIVWIIDMVLQLIPTKGYLPIGSTKKFKEFYQSVKNLPNKKEFISLFKKSSLDALKTLIIWIILIAVIGILWGKGLLTQRELLLISVIFYVLDLTFVLFWCPFRAWILKNRCCTTCRIFNWDHLMMFSPILFVRGFYAYSLFGMSIVNFLVWELCFFLHPERFFEETNATLRCSNCNDKLCGNKNCKL